MMRAMMDGDEPWEPVLPLHDDFAGDTRVVGLRVVQFALDVLLVQVSALALATAVAFGLRLVIGADHEVVLVLAFVLLWLWLSLLGWLLVTVLWPVLRGGRTPAMSWCGLRVVTLDGLAPRPTAHVLRCAVTLVDGFAFGLIGLVVMASTGRQRRLGDLVAGTLVVRDPRH
jgi:uncharacterized RDD family membrane protein YckC